MIEKCGKTETADRPRRNAEATRDRILQAARSIFTRKSYEKTGVREIAQAAGVDPALVIRYFGCKETLFDKALLPDGALGALRDVPNEEYGAALARLFLHAEDGKRDFDPILAALNSASHPCAQKSLKEFFEREGIQPLASTIEGECAQQRASLAFALLVGTVLLRHGIRCEPLASIPEERLTKAVGDAIQAILKSQSA